MSDRDGRTGRAGSGGRAGRGRTRGSGDDSRPSWRDDRIWQAGFLLGSALGAAATVAGRHAEKAARRGLVDWPEVERIAIGRLAKAPGALDEAELHASEPAYAEAMARIVPALTAALGSELPGVVERAGVVDRAGWVRANTGSFASLMGKLERDLLDEVMPPGGGLAKATMALANRWVTTRQLGFLLGFMGTRVLGQYDLALLSAEVAPGRLLFVEENIRTTARALGVPIGPFRTWIALHETTHAFEFEAHPWLRPYLADRLERQLTLFGKDARGLGREALRGLGVRGERDRPGGSGLRAAPDWREHRDATHGRPLQHEHHGYRPAVFEEREHHPLLGCHQPRGNLSRDRRQRRFYQGDQALRRRQAEGAQALRERAAAPLRILFSPGAAHSDARGDTFAG